jgi:WhiB family redox-sensing transcriptional regulator
MVKMAEWNTMGNCRNGNPERFFGTGAKQRDARSICRDCPVLKQCLAMALNDKMEYGVWGGMTERERRAMLKARPDVTCWSSFLDQVTAQPLAPVLPLVPIRKAHPVPAAALADAA